MSLRSFSCAAGGLLSTVSDTVGGVTKTTGDLVGSTTSGTGQAVTSAGSTASGAVNGVGSTTGGIIDTTNGALRSAAGTVGRRHLLQGKGHPLILHRANAYVRATVSCAGAEKGAARYM